MHHVRMDKWRKVRARLWELDRQQCSHRIIQVNWLHKFPWRSPSLKSQEIDKKRIRNRMSLHKVLAQCQSRTSLDLD